MTNVSEQQNSIIFVASTSLSLLASNLLLRLRIKSSSSSPHLEEELTRLHRVLDSCSSSSSYEFGGDRTQLNSQAKNGVGSLSLDTTLHGSGHGLTSNGRRVDRGMVAEQRVAYYKHETCRNGSLRL